MSRQARICDRCGSFYKAYMVGTGKQMVNGIALVSILEDGRYKVDKLIDLCPDCKENLKKWLKKGGAECLDSSD